MCLKGNESKHNTCLSGTHLVAELFCGKSGEALLMKEALDTGQRKGRADFPWVTSQLREDLFIPSLPCQSGIFPGGDAV